MLAVAFVASQNFGESTQVTTPESVESVAFAASVAEESGAAMPGHTQVHSPLRPWAPMAVAADYISHILLLAPGYNCCRRWHSWALCCLPRKSRATLAASKGF